MLNVGLELPAFGARVISPSAANGQTNAVSNPTMSGASAGSPGTVPTNWAYSTDAGLTTTLATGTSDSINYIDIHWVGTSSGTFTALFMEAAATIAALQNQIWSFSVYWALVAGSFTNVTAPKFGWQEDNSGGTPLVNDFLTPAFPNSSTLLAQKLIFTAQLSNASTAFIRPLFQFNLTASSAIDFTVRFGFPRLVRAA